MGQGHEARGREGTVLEWRHVRGNIRVKPRKSRKICPRPSGVPGGLVCLVVWCAWWSGVPGGLVCLVVFYAHASTCFGVVLALLTYGVCFSFCLFLMPPVA